MQTDRFPEKIKRLIDSSWQNGRYIFTTDQIEELRLAMLYEKAKSNEWWNKKLSSVVTNKKISKEKIAVITEIIAFSAGGASMCWFPIPQGEFNSNKALEIVEATVKKIVGILEEDATI